MEENILTLTEKVIKIRNSKSRYIKIPDGYFDEIKHGDTAKIAEVLETDNNEIKIMYIFKKKLKRGKEHGKKTNN